MKVLILTWEFPPNLTGGLGRHVAELAPALATLGVSVHVVTPYPEGDLAYETPIQNLVIHRVSISQLNIDGDIYAQAQATNPHLLQAAQTLWTTMGGFDLVHVHDWLVSFAALQLKDQYKCPVIATIHATEKGRWRSESLVNPLSQAIDQAEQALMYEAWRVIACSHYMIGNLMRVFHLPEDKLDMIPNGIQLSTEDEVNATVPNFTHLPAITLRASLGITDQAPLIFSVGRLSYEKGLHILLGAMPNVIDIFPDVKLVIAGRGPLLGHLQSIVTDMHLEQHIDFAGFISDEERNHYFQAANCAVFPSLYEPFGITALEAMANRCPVVASNVGGLAEVVDHDETGILVYPDNSESTAWGILEVLKKPVQSDTYANQAYQMLHQRYGWTSIALETKRVYERVIEERESVAW